MPLETEVSEPTPERTALSIPVKIEAHNSPNGVWREISRIESVSGTKAAFCLTRACEIGELLLLKMPIKKKLRRFDFDTEQYRVWGVVRRCEQTSRNNSPVYLVSVAFIGQEPPAGFRRDPSTIYKLEKIGENGFWEISELRRGPEKRRQPRYTIPLNLVIAVCDAEGNITAHEQTVTENISASGASVFSTLPLKIGDTVRVIKEHRNFSAAAIVRNRRVGKDNLPRLHLEFINAVFPIEGID